MSSATLIQWRTAGRQHAHRGRRVFYREAGAARADTALVLIHGFPTASWDWHRLWDPLSGKFPRLLAADMLGFGFSDKPRRYPYSFFDQADLHEELLHALGVRRYHILAHDYGDTVAQELLARHLERGGAGNAPLPLSCCLLNGGLFPEAIRPVTMQKLLLGPLGPLVGRLIHRRAFGRSFSAIFGPHTRPTPAELDDFWALIRHGNGTAVVHEVIQYMNQRVRHRERWTDALRRAPVPLRLIYGAQDPISGESVAARFRELVPRADSVVLPAIGHYPQIEDPAGVLGHVLDFHETSRADLPS